MERVDVRTPPRCWRHGGRTTALPHRLRARLARWSGLRRVGHQAMRSRPMDRLGCAPAARAHAPRHRHEPLPDPPLGALPAPALDVRRDDRRTAAGVASTSSGCHRSIIASTEQRKKSVVSNPESPRDQIQLEWSSKKVNIGSHPESPASMRASGVLQGRRIRTGRHSFDQCVTSRLRGALRPRPLRAAAPPWRDRPARRPCSGRCPTRHHSGVHGTRSSSAAPR